jgi:hypothetical protein
VNRDSSVAIVARVWAGRPRNPGLIHERSKMFISSPNHPNRLLASPSFLIGGDRWSFPRKQSGRGVKLTTHCYLNAGINYLSGDITTVPLMPSWRAQGHLYLYFCAWFSLLAISYKLKAQIRYISLTGFVGKWRSMLIYAGTLMETTELMFMCVCVCVLSCKWSHIDMICAE